MDRRSKIVRVAVVGLSTSLIVAFAIQGARANLAGCKSCIEASDIASNAVGSSEIINGSILGKDIKGGAVHSSDITNGTILPKDLNAASKILMWAETETDDVNTFPAVATSVPVNSIGITVPRAGFLVISGTAYVNNNTAAASTYEFDLEAKLDGSAINAGTDQATTRVTEDGSGNDDANLSYTATVAVTAGAHTVSQEVDPSGSDWFYNGNYLTVLFIPSGLGTLETIATT
jgi:hypothetical protein